MFARSNQSWIALKFNWCSFNSWIHTIRRHHVFFSRGNIWNKSTNLEHLSLAVDPLQAAGPQAVDAGVKTGLFGKTWKTTEKFKMKGYEGRNLTFLGETSTIHHFLGFNVSFWECTCFSFIDAYYPTLLMKWSLGFFFGDATNILEAFRDSMIGGHCGFVVFLRERSPMTTLNLPPPKAGCCSSIQHGRNFTANFKHLKQITCGSNSPNFQRHLMRCFLTV